MTKLPADVDDLAKLNLNALRDLWRAHLSGPPPSRTTEILRRELAWRLMERSHGVMPASLRRQLDAAGRQTSTGAKPSAPRPELGVTLVKTWNGRTHRVQVVADGYIYEGATYASLSPIARRITGVRWSGPRFFGLGATQARR